MDDELVLSDGGTLRSLELFHVTTVTDPETQYELREGSLRYYFIDGSTDHALIPTEADYVFVRRGRDYAFHPQHLTYTLIRHDD